MKIGVFLSQVINMV